jgi:hypothetical protein
MQVLHVVAVPRPAHVLVGIEPGGLSTLITSAPKSAKMRTQVGPARTRERSSTRRRLRAEDGVGRGMANNPSLMTYHGTNTYLIETEDGFAVLDPGPDDDGHLEDILRATGGAVRSC